MQFSVPQFTDVEDKIIGSLTVKQFGIIFAAGVIIFLFYSLTKSLPVLVAAGVLVGLPALGIAFAKPYGRPMYKTIPYMIKFLLSPKILIFHKETLKASEATKPPAPAPQAPAAKAAPASSPEQRLREVNRLLAKNASEEEELLKKMK